MSTQGRARESLEGVLKKLEQELKAKSTAVQAKPSTTPAAAAAQPKAPPSSAPSSGGGASDRLTYTAINSFGWDQASPFFIVFFARRSSNTHIKDITLIL